VRSLESILDAHVLLNVDINPESRVKVEEGAAKPDLVEAGTRLFLVKVINHGNVRAPLVVQSPNSGDVYVRSNGSPAPPIQLSPQESKERWANISLYQRPPMRPRLSGLALEYAILEVYSRDAGQRSAKISFNVGQGSQDIGFRNDVTVLFTALPARRITLRVKDEKGRPTMASFIIKDRLDRIYPLPSKRLAPDFFFQPQIYRADGESVQLPKDYYTFEYTGGPEYLTRTRELTADSNELSFQLERWIDPCELRLVLRRPPRTRRRLFPLHEPHRRRPARGHDAPDPGRTSQHRKRAHLGPGLLLPEAVLLGERPSALQARSPHALRPGGLRLSVESRGPHHPAQPETAGLPGTKKIDDWPTWDLPIFRWAKSQGAVVGFAHSGWGLQVSGKELPTYQMPGFDGIGANEYIVDVTHPNTVDFISAVDTPYVGS
jgi:hypothetical protein